jgi:N-acetylglutamate synthase-like GNAT family acetyltransferase
MKQDSKENMRKKYAQAFTNLYALNEMEEFSKDIVKKYAIRTAINADLSVINKLLSENGLTTSGVRENLLNFLVAECEDVVGVIGIEFAGHGVMIRSLAISQELRRRGMGAALFNRCLEIARAAGSKNAYLLTNTAEQFVARWGFHKIQRSEIPVDLMQSSTLNNFCPLSSSCMKLEL